MPQLLPAAAAWAAAAWSSAVTATAVGLTHVGVMAAIGEGATIALAGKLVATAATLGLSAAATAMMRPNTPSSGTTLDFKPDPKASIRGAMGYTAIGANKAMQASWGYNRVALSLGVALSMGPIDGVVQFQADGSPVAFTGPQNEATGFYAADMWQKTTLGLPDYTVLLPPVGLKYGNPGLTGWGPQHAAPQVAFGFWTMVLAKNPEDRDVFTNGVPDPRWILRGMKVWDPRKDDTYPGGSGPQRRNDWRTWAFSENAWVHAIAWLRGHHKLNLDGTIDRTKRIAGVGAPDAAIDLAAYVEGANVADANAWTISGEWSTGDGKWQTLASILQAGGGRPINRGAQISALVHTPRVSTYTYTKADLIGQAQIKPLTPRRDRKNTIIPRYRSEAHNWEYVAAGEVTAQTYRDEDRGEPRSSEVQYTLVRGAKQAGQLAAYDLANLREGLTATLPSKSYMQHIHAGDCITINEPELALVNQKVIVVRASGDYRSASWTLEVRSETDAKHPWALGQTSKEPSSPTLSAVDPNHVPPPRPDDWSVVPKPPAPDGTSQPIIIIVGKVETSDIAEIIIEHAPADDGPWTLAYSGVPSIEGRYEAKGLSPEIQYWVSVRYVAKNGAASDRMVTGPYLAGKLIAGGLTDEARDKLVNKVIEDVGTQIGEGIEAGKKALERSKGNLLLTLRNAKNALDGTLKEEADREAQTGDLQDRIDIGFLIDPVLKTGIIREDVLVQGTGETFVQMNTRLVARDDENALQTAQVVIDAQAYTDREVSLATANLVAAAQMETAISAALLSMEAYADAASASATTGLASVAQVDDRIAAANLLLRGYVDAEIVEATTGLASLVQVDNKVAAADLALRSWTTNQITGATAGLASVAQVDDKVGVASLQLQSLLDAYKVEATGTFATQSSLGGVSSQAGLALSTAVAADGKASATIGLTSTVDGVLTGIFSHNDGAKPWIRVQSSVFEVLDNAVTGERFEIAGKRVKGWYANGQQAYQLG